MSYGAAARQGAMWGFRIGRMFGPLGGIVGPLAGAAIALGGTAILNQMREGEDAAEEELETEEETGACTECGERELPADPEDLLEEGFEEEETRAPNRRRFVNPETGEVIEFDQGVEGRNGWAGRDHYHRPNPNATGKGDAYLDRNGNPVPRGSGASHISPGTIVSTGTPSS